MLILTIVGGAGLTLHVTGGDEMLAMAMNVYGKPTHTHQVYLPYYQGQMLYTRKSLTLSGTSRQQLTITNTQPNRLSFARCFYINFNLMVWILDTGEITKKLNDWDE